MLKRYIGEQEVSVTLAGQDFGTVTKGDAISVPDELANSLAWPENLWASDGAKPDDENDDEDNEDGN